VLARSRRYVYVVKNNISSSERCRSTTTSETDGRSSYNVIKTVQITGDGAGEGMDRVGKDRQTKFSIIILEFCSNVEKRISAEAWEETSNTSWQQRRERTAQYDESVRVFPRMKSNIKLLVFIGENTDGTNRRKDTISKTTRANIIHR
jgi:hypothetical protein